MSEIFTTFVFRAGTKKLFEPIRTRGEACQRVHPGAAEQPEVGLLVRPLSLALRTACERFKNWTESQNPPITAPKVAKIARATVASYVSCWPEPCRGTPSTRLVSNVAAPLSYAESDEVGETAPPGENS